MSNEIFVDAMRYAMLFASYAITIILSIAAMFLLTRFVEYVVDIVQEAFTETKRMQEKKVQHDRSTFASGAMWANNVGKSLSTQEILDESYRRFPNTLER